MKITKSQLRQIIREELNESNSKDMKKLIDFLVTKGNNRKEATNLVKKRYNYIKRVYPDATLSKQAQIIKTVGEEIQKLNENKGKSEATKIINKWRRSLFPKLSEDELWEFGSAMRKFFKDYK